MVNGSSILPLGANNLINNMTQLKQLSEKIKKAVPSVYSVGMWVAGKLIKGKWRPISLENVLMALEQANTGTTDNYCCFMDGTIVRIGDKKDICKWQLCKNLSEQSEEVINKLNEIL
jgi:hypothetical protein